MRLSTRKLLDRSFTGAGLFSIALMGAALAVLLAPIIVRGVRAFVFQGTVEHRRFQLEKHGRGASIPAGATGRAAGQPWRVLPETAQVQAARQPVYEAMAAFERDMETSRSLRRQYAKPYADFKKNMRTLLGPIPGEPLPVLAHEHYGQTRWDRAQVWARRVLYVDSYDYSDPTRLGVKVQTPRAGAFEGTALAPVFPYIERNLEALLRPRWTFYWGFLTDDQIGSNILGGIGPAVLGTFYLTLGAMLIAGPLGIIAAIYFIEYAGQNWFVSLLRTCVSTLAGVPSIVFGMFGLTFFIKTIHVSPSKSVLAGSLTLALLVLPTVIRAAEEAIRAVPQTYREASLALGAGKWRTIVTVILPAALSGILTGVIISMGRAAGETAPIIFTAAVSLGKPLALRDIFSQPTMALPWNIYNLATEHEAADEIRHVQYGMVLTLVALVLGLNLAAIILRARIARRLRG